MTTLEEWVKAHGNGPVSRVVKRIERFSGNTTDPDTSLAADDLVKMIREAQE